MSPVGGPVRSPFGNAAGSGDDFRITRLLLWATAAEAVILVVTGLGLFVSPKLTAQFWPWTDLTPFNSRFLGAIYLASLVAVLFMLATRRWAPARVVVPMIGVFTLAVLVVSLVNIGRFAFDRTLITFGWFLFYLLLPINAFAHLWYYRGRPPADPVSVPPGWGRWLRILAVLTLGYGLGMLVAPVPLTAFWPWGVDAFHGSMYAATFVASGVGFWLVARSAAPVELRMVGVGAVTLGGLSILGLVWNGVETGRAVWSAPGAFAWLAIFLVIAGTGVVTLALRGARRSVGVSQQRGQVNVVR